jgi:ABC-type multidrug transport system ATPase subunit
VKRFADVTAVNGLDLEVFAGECFGLLSPNGAGKTTTVEILEGLARPDEGKVELLGQRQRQRVDKATALAQAQRAMRLRRTHSDLYYRCAFLLVGQMK